MYKLLGIYAFFFIVVNILMIKMFVSLGYINFGNGTLINPSLCYLAFACRSLRT